MLTISQFAKRARVSADAVRFYERQSLIAPASRTSSGYRLYDEHALRRVAFIKHAQQCGFSLEDIRALLPAPGADSCAAAAYRLALEKKGEIESRISALHAMSLALSNLITDYAGAAQAARPCWVDATLLNALEAQLALR